MSTIGEKLKKVRKGANLTQAELAKRLGVSQQMVAAYENNKRTPKLETINKIASSLNCSPVDILGLSDTTKSIKETYDIKIKDTPIENYLYSIGYNVLYEEKQCSTKPPYIDFDLTDEQRDMLEKYGCVVTYEYSYLIEKEGVYYRLSKNEFELLIKEINGFIEYQLQKYHCSLNSQPKYNQNT